MKPEHDVELQTTLRQKHKHCPSLRIHEIHIVGDRLQHISARDPSRDEGHGGYPTVVDARRTKEIALVGRPQSAQVLAHGIRNLRVVVPILMRRRVLGKVKVSTLIARDQYQYHRDRYGEPAAPVECRARV